MGLPRHRLYRLSLALAWEFALDIRIKGGGVQLFQRVRDFVGLRCHIEQGRALWGNPLAEGSMKRKQPKNHRTLEPSAEAAAGSWLRLAAFSCLAAGRAADFAKTGQCGGTSTTVSARIGDHRHQKYIELRYALMQLADETFVQPRRVVACRYKGSDLGGPLYVEFSWPSYDSCT